MLVCNVSVRRVAAAAGALAATEAADAAAFLGGGVAATGVLAATEAADAAAFLGGVAATGVLAATEAADAAAFLGGVAATGVLVATEAADAAAFTGSVAAGAISGSMAATEAPDIMAGTGNVASDPWTFFSSSDHSANIALSNNNRTAVYSGTTVDAAARMSSYISGSDKDYFEFTLNTALTGGDAGGGAAISTSTLANIASAAAGAFLVYRSGNIWSNSGNAGKNVGAALTSGVTVGIAINRGTGNGWARICPTGNWNGVSTADPATNTGGIALPAGAMTPAATFGGTGGTAGNSLTFNVGQSAFVGAVPSGYTAGVPA